MSRPAATGAASPARARVWAVPRARVRRRAGRWRLPWPALVLVFLAAALLATVVIGAGHYVQDSRFDLFWNPSVTVDRVFSAWDGTRGLGLPLPDFTPVLSFTVLALRDVGFSPAVTERLLNALLLTTGGVGVAMVLRCWRAPLGIEHVAAGLLYMFNPFTASFLVPSLLFVNYALAPWFLLAFERGARGVRPWRWAAAFALFVFVAGFGNVPGLLWAMLPIVPTAWYLVAVERSVPLRRMLAWVARAFLLTAVVSAAGLFKTLLGSSGLQVNLASTESTQAISLASSWAETWRGLGFWLSYWVDGLGVVKPQTEVFFTSAPVVVATFAAPLLALAVLWRSRWRPRLAFAAIALTSLVVMVGAFPFDAPTPFGRLLVDLYDAQPALYGFRNTYKAGAGLALGVAVLCGIGIAVALRVLVTRRSPLALGAFGTAAIIVFALASAPFWTGSLYAGTGVTNVPTYYRAAFSWLDRRPGTSRVLVLPGTGAAIYRWGSPGDDIVDAGLARPHIVRSPLPFSGTSAEAMIDALDQVLGAGVYQPGTLAPIARRLGVGYVMVRNDLDWQRLQIPRPATYEALRQDPGLQRVRDFGPPGQGVVARGADQHAPNVALERRLPPVEVFRVVGNAPSARVVSRHTRTLVSGDGAAVVSAQEHGLLDPGRGVQYTGDLSASALTSALAGGSDLVVTDTNRYRVTGVGTYGPTVGPTLTATAPPPRGAGDIYRRAGSRTVVDWGDARSVTVAATATGLPLGAASDPANAFDTDPTSAWLTGAYTTSAGQRLRVDFRHPRTVSGASLVVADPCCGGRRVVTASVRFPDGSAVPVGFDTSLTATVRFSPRRVQFVDVVIDRTVGPGSRPIGFSEISFDGADVRPYIQLPDDAFRLAARDPALARQLALAPTAYVFDGASGTEAGVSLLRRFRTANTRSMQLSGALRVGTTTTDEIIDAVAGRAVVATSPDRVGSAPDSAALYAVDGDPTTAWAGAAKVGTALTLTFPRRTVDELTITVGRGAGVSFPATIRLDVGGTSQTVDVARACARQFGSRCTVPVVVPLGTVAERAVVTVERVDTRLGALGPDPIKVGEISFDGMPNPPLATAGESPCVDIGTVVDGIHVPVRVAGGIASLLEGHSASFVGCAPTVLRAGWHRFVSGTAMAVENVALADAHLPRTAATSTSAASVRTLTSSATRLRFRVDVPPPGTTLVVNRSFDTAWTATARGRSLGPPHSVDGQLAWDVDGTGTTNVTVQYQPQHTLDRAFLVTLLGLVLCVAIALGPPGVGRFARTRRLRREPAPMPTWISWRADEPTPVAPAVVGASPPPVQLRPIVSAPEVITAVVAVVLCFVVAGLPGAMLAAAALAASRVASPRVVAAGAVALLAVTAALTLVEGDLVLGPSFASDRSVGSWTGAAAVVLAIVAVIAFVRDLRRVP